MALWRKSTPNRLAIFALLVIAGTVCAAASVDIDGSGRVDSNDLAIMQDYWLGPGPIADIGGAGGNSDGTVDGLDFAVLGQSWLDDTSETIAALVAEALEFSQQQCWSTALNAPGPSSYPYATLDDGDPGTEPYDVWQYTMSWTGGFFPGCLWYLYELTGDPNYSTWAQDWLVGLESQQYNTGTHDVGFMILCSYGNGYRLTGNSDYVPIIIQTAESLATRYSPIVGCIRSWGSMTDYDNFKVIIDNMMNLEIMFWATKHGGDQELTDIAISHAYKTIENHVREDGTTNHIVIYDPCTGEVTGTATNPGYSADSCWSRGQAWAVYGFTMCYRETGDPNFLDTAKQVSDYFVDNLPADNVPYYDFDDPAIPNVIKDSSAASIAAAGLLELCEYVTEPALQQKYFQAAKDILVALSTRYSDSGYMAKDALGDPIGPSILMRGYKVYERGTIWGDYYFIEALMRYNKLLGK